MKVASFFYLLFLLLIESTANAASLSGYRLQYQTLFPTIDSNFDYPSSGNGIYVVGNDVEIIGNAGLADVDFGEQGFSIVFYATNLTSFIMSEFNGVRVTDYDDLIPDFIDFNVSESNGLSEAPKLSFDKNNLYINFSGISFTNAKISFSISTSNSNIPSNVPIPPSLFLFASALLGGVRLSMVSKQRKHVH